MTLQALNNASLLRNPSVASSTSTLCGFATVSLAGLSSPDKRIAQVLASNASVTTNEPVCYPFGPISDRVELLM